MSQELNPDERYIFDARASQFTVQAFSQGLGGIADHRPQSAIGDFSGYADLPNLNFGASSFNVKVNLASLALKDELKESDRRTIEQLIDEVLETKNFPEVEFRSSRITSALVGANRYRVGVTGTLKLHGISNHLAMEAQVAATDNSLRAYGEFTVRQTDYGIKLASVAGGAIHVKDELKFVFYIVARKNA